VTVEGAPGRVLALDYGKARTGVAVSDPSRTIVQARDPILRASSSDGLASIAALVASLGVTEVVVGLPVGLRGTETKQTAQCRSFAARLAGIVDVPVRLHDERFTTKLADRTAAATGTGTSRDSIAASHLLESWMEASDR
jgi:putative holliday junction resolvase